MSPSSSSRSVCKLCGGETCAHGGARVRGRHEASYLRCKQCGFLFVESAPWLAEAYTEPINKSDTGYVSRNLSCQARVGMFIELFLNPAGRFLDYAAGYGLLVRLMRDAGYDFRWSDQYCENLFARGFEAPEPLAGPFDAITAFEVFEHWLDPVRELTRLAPLTQCILFSTVLVPEPPPLLSEWWYYELEHGQHISFYTLRSLQFLAGRFGFHFVSDGEAFHALTRQPLSASQFKRIDRRLWRSWIRRTRRRNALTAADSEAMREQARKAAKPCGEPG